MSAPRRRPPPRPPFVAELPASLEAMVNSATMMLTQIDALRAETHVQQLTNGHGDDRIFNEGADPEMTYAERYAQLDMFEKNLRDGLPKVVLDRLETKDEEES